MKLLQAIISLTVLPIMAAAPKSSSEKRISHRTCSILSSAGLECSRNNPLRGKPHIKPRPDTPHGAYRVPKMEPKKEFSRKFLESRSKRLEARDHSVPLSHSSRTTTSTIVKE